MADQDKVEFESPMKLSDMTEGPHSLPAIDHPDHYGGDTPYEHIKVAEAWGLNYALGNATKYICRAGKKGGRRRAREHALEDLRKAAWYIQHEIERLEKS